MPRVLSRRTLSRQRRWQLEQKKKFCCHKCGKPVEPGYKKCRPCLAYTYEYNRTYRLRKLGLDTSKLKLPPNPWLNQHTTI